MATYFDKEALAFLRGLKKNNDRIWFNDRKDIYIRAVKEPMQRLVTDINYQMAEFMPELIRPAEKCMMRIYRDTRFSKNKTPYKTHQAAWWGRTGVGKGGGGFYLSIGAKEMTIAAGMYMPDNEQLLAVRRMLLDRHKEFRAALRGAAKRGLMMESFGDSLTRAPKGFPSDHPGLDLIKQKRWGVYVDLPAEAALKPNLLPEVMKRFRAAETMIAMLNSTLRTTKKRPIFGL